MPVPERELFIILRELHRWLAQDPHTVEPLALKDALEKLFSKAERAAMEPLTPVAAELARTGDVRRAAIHLRSTAGCSLADAHHYVTDYVNAIAGKPLTKISAAPKTLPACLFCSDGQLIREDGVERCDNCGASAPLDEEP